MATATNILAQIESEGFSDAVHKEPRWNPYTSQDEQNAYEAGYRRGEHSLIKRAA